ncbi:amino acid permease [Maribacter polysiphoniae]|uniref:Amino acid permease n=1 Tax=Maribacter polysiphoniae TaxID=429344 RepID=A0A316DRU4_9FLAO|nr:amino acid permease [Maribacter polysiphoniae]MBD1262865.1 amino acid permease [Maribacter polysiphoniae]PWK20182.1 cation-chloride cotransporter (CCC family) [Maribacter polysiphoniae]
MGQQEKNTKKFNTFGGVFTPTLLTILGVIMYLRLGWVVGNAGLLGAWLIIIVSFLITLCTALSMSAITTNIRIGAGGAYAIISQSLGLEVGGSLGIPRYISQGLAVTMYIFGFREGWLTIFPGHEPFLVDILVFGVLLTIAYISADLAIKTQFFIMVIIILSLFSIVLAAYYGSMHIPVEDAIRWGTFKGSIENGFTGSDFWLVFAVFFPAATGIMAGANMSGELANPKKSIPQGTLWAIGVSFLIYMLLAYWLARTATEQELISNYNIIVEKSFVGPLIVAGILGATFSSALASLVGSSRILFAMGEHRVLPYGEFLSGKSTNGQPRNAMVVTGVIIFATMLLRDLNAIAPLVTLFFLITYAMINIVVIIEQRLGLISYRPIFKVYKWIPWLGLSSSVLAMFIINPTISLVSISIVFVVYWFLARQNLETPFEDVRSGLFVSFAEWAAKHTWGMKSMQQRAWKPNLMVPIRDIHGAKGNFQFLRNIAKPKGSIKLLGIEPFSEKTGFRDELANLSESFRKKGVFSSWTVIHSDDFAQGVNYGNQALQGAFFKPNIVFLNLQEHDDYETELRPVIKECIRLEIGVLLYLSHPMAQLGQRNMINVWVRDRKDNWDLGWDIGNLDLSILVAYKLKKNWDASIRLIIVIDDEGEKENAQQFLLTLINLARLPETLTEVYVGNFKEIVEKSPAADLNIFGMEGNLQFEFVKEISAKTGSSCLFVKDSGHESILA